MLSVRLQTSRHTPHGYVYTSYSPSEIDAVVAYSTELKRSFLLPIAEVAGRRGAHLRFEATRNNQAEGIKWAADYELAPMINKLRNAPHVDCSCDRQLNLPSSVSGL